MEKITLPKGVSWTAHGLAVEGVQPLIPENPPAILPKDVDQEITKSGPPQTNGTFPLTPPSESRSTVKKQQQQLVKQVLSRKLQLYYTRLTLSLSPPTADSAKRTAALASLRNDAGLQTLLPYLIRWVGEGVVTALTGGAQFEADDQSLEVLDVVSAILEENTLFIWPYVGSPPNP